MSDLLRNFNVHVKHLIGDDCIDALDKNENKKENRLQTSNQQLWTSSFNSVIMNHLDDKTKIMSLIIKQLGFVFIASMVEDTNSYITQITIINKTITNIKLVTGVEASLAVWLCMTAMVPSTINPSSLHYLQQSLTIQRLCFFIAEE